MPKANTTANAEVDGAALIRARRRSRKDFEAFVEKLRRQGTNDREIVRAMAKSNQIIDTLRLNR